MTLDSIFDNGLAGILAALVALGSGCDIAEEEDSPGSTSGTTATATATATATDYDPCVAMPLAPECCDSGGPACGGNSSTTVDVCDSGGPACEEESTTQDPCASGGPACEEESTGEPPDPCPTGDAKLVIEDIIDKTIAEHLWVAGGVEDPTAISYAVSMYVTDFQHLGSETLPGPCTAPEPGLGSCSADPASGQWYCQRVGCEADGVRSAEAWITSVDDPNPDTAPGLMYRTDFPAGVLETDRPYRHWLIEQAGDTINVSSSFSVDADLATGSPVQMQMQGTTQGPIDGAFTVSLQWPLIVSSGPDLIAELTVPLEGPATGELTFEDGEVIGTFDGEVSWSCP